MSKKREIDLLSGEVCISLINEPLDYEIAPLNEAKIVGLWQTAAEQARQNLTTMQAQLSEVAGKFEALRPKIGEAKGKLAEPTAKSAVS